MRILFLLSLLAVARGATTISSCADITFTSGPVTLSSSIGCTSQQTVTFSGNQPITLVVDLSTVSVVLTKLRFVVDGTTTLQLTATGAVVAGAELQFTENDVYSNGVHLNGGAISISGTGTLISQVPLRFLNNQADNGGAIYVAPGATLSLGRSAAFVGNHANEVSGGAVWAPYGTGLGGLTFGDPNFSGDTLFTFDSNTNGGDGGGAIRANSIPVTFYKPVVFTNNLAPHGAALFVNNNAVTFWSTSTFSGNLDQSQSNAGAIYISSASMILKCIEPTGGDVTSGFYSDQPISFAPQSRKDQICKKVGKSNNGKKPNGRL